MLTDDVHEAFGEGRIGVHDGDTTKHVERHKHVGGHSEGVEGAGLLGHRSSFGFGVQCSAWNTAGGFTWNDTSISQFDG